VAIYGLGERQGSQTGGNRFGTASDISCYLRKSPSRDYGYREGRNSRKVWNFAESITGRLLLRQTTGMEALEVLQSDQFNSKLKTNTNSFCLLPSSDYLSADLSTAKAGLCFVNDAESKDQSNFLLQKKRVTRKKISSHRFNTWWHGRKIPLGEMRAVRT